MTLEEMLRNVAGETMVNRLHSGELQPVTEATQISDQLNDQSMAADRDARRRAGLYSYARQAIGLLPQLGGATLTTPEKLAFASSAADPFGLTSGLLDRFSPGTGEAWRKSYQEHPLMAVTGGMATPMPGVNMLSGMLKGGRLLKTLPLGGGLAALLGDDAYGAH